MTAARQRTVQEVDRAATAFHDAFSQLQVPLRAHTRPKMSDVVKGAPGVWQGGPAGGQHQWRDPSPTSLSLSGHAWRIII